MNLTEDSTIKMTSLKPYLIRAIHEWIVDNQFTPYLLVNAEADGVVVPNQYVNEGKIILNTRPQVVENLHLGTSKIEFDARFNGSPIHMQFPVSAVLAIYAKENGKGMTFNENDTDGDEAPISRPSPTKKSSKPNLRVVK